MRRQYKILIFFTVLIMLTIAANPTATMIEHQCTDATQVTKVSWKAVDYGGDFFHLYVTVNGEKDYYAGYFFGENFETNENAGVQDAPKDALTTFSAEWTGAGEWFYMYQKSDSELALMNHPYGYRSTPDEWEEYKEILVFPIEKDSQTAD